MKVNINVDKLMPLANAVSKNKYLLTLRDTFITFMPALIVGSITMLISEFPVEAWTNMLRSTYIGSSTIADLLMIPPSCTMSLMGVFAAFLIGYRYAEHDGLKDRTSAGLVTLVSWFILMPFTTEFTPDGSTETYLVESIPTRWVGSKGILVAILAGFLSVKIYAALIHRDVTIKMPAGVPEAVSRAFSALIPFTASFLVIFTIRVLFSLTPYGDPFDFVFNVLQLPLQNIGGSLAGCVTLRLIAQSLWCLGIHGSSITSTVYDPILMALSAENMEAVAAGQAPTNIINQQFSNLFVSIGGDGTTICLLIAILVFCTSKRIRQLGKLAIVPGMFNINEPVTFGLPIILNPIMAIPFILVPVVLTISTYAVMAVGLVPICNGVSVPWTCPPIISGFLVSGVAGSLWQVCELIIGTLIYLPFIKVMDRQAQLEEEAALKSKDELDSFDLDSVDLDSL